MELEEDFGAKQSARVAGTQFVENINKEPTAYRERIPSARERFMKYPITSVVQRVHETFVNTNIPCAGPVGVNCPHCPPGSPRISEIDLTSNTTNHVPLYVKQLHAKRACTHQHPSVVPEHNTPQTMNPTAPWLASYAFTISTSSRGFGETTYLEGDPIDSNEYKPRGGSYRGQSYASVGMAGRSPYGQSQVDHSLQALYARVEALERLQAVPIADQKQQLNLQKAYVAEFAQTT
ncbi:hypothetical protein PHMEG_0007132 [Phytophthora megakarya]|uniref:Uncharacterized protein n=1 Tax=Phytophthora megakarya TaxID=4795 RepID=A0A225WPH3_9STRA|nr:hypothetical protein PHMEG_0007132 [Phytophthora megakarya]